MVSLFHINRRLLHHSMLIIVSVCCYFYGSSALSSKAFITQEMSSRLLKEYSPQAAKRGKALNKLIKKLQGKSVQTKLKEVNRFFNQFTYIEDIKHWGKKDYWATPEEFIGTQAGDCEDFVIAKYFVLRKLGIADEKLYLTYVKHIKKNIAHMVLSYFKKPSSNPQILDNYNPKILRGSERNDLLPVYSFNASKLFLTNSSAGLGKSLPTDKIKNSKWTKLLDDIRNEKL